MSRDLGDSISRLLDAEFRKEVFIDSAPLNQRAKASDEIEFEIGDLLFGDVQRLGDSFVGPTLHDQQLDALELHPIAAFLPTRDLIVERLLQHILLDAPTFDAAYQTARASLVPRELPLTARLASSGK